ncbi:MAG: Xaa-Pro dipeptidase, partial [Candidatus Thioglobus sp.]|nr:Xaa-Pro dipeptidase [Candidatus Thioglobus sp.]
GFDLAYDIKKLNSIFPTLLGDFQNYYYDFKTTDFDNIISPLLPAAKSLKPYLAEMRIVKSAEEIRLMKLAAEISVTAHKQAMQQACGGLFEYEIASLFDGYFRKNNAEHAYTPIVAGGKNACVLHYIKNNQRLNSGELLLIDAGCEVEGYAADISRTFPVNGKFTSAQAEIYQIVLNAQKAAIESICPNEIVTQPHQIALKIIQQGLLDLGILQAGDDVKKFYMHNTGHWLGLDVHDAGEYKINQQPRRFAAGMVITVEPGIYIRKDAKIDPIYWNIGVRIEDDVLVTENGNSVLSGELPKEINEIEKLMSKKIKQII